MSEIAAGAGAELAEKGTEEIVKRASRIYEALKGRYRVLSQEIVVHCPEQVQQFSLAFEATGGLLGQNKVRFPFGRPIRARLRPIMGGADLSESIIMVENGFEINCQGMRSEDTFLLEAEYNFPDPKFMDALVHRERAKELPKDVETEYWMHAALKHPKALQTKYGRLDLRDLDFTVDVGVSEDIKTSIPGVFKVELDAAFKLLKEKDPHRKTVLGIQHIRAMRGRGKGRNILELLGDLQEIFLPNGFSQFVDVSKDFRYANCFRGLSYYETIPFPTWPKNMTVVSRTDLGLDRCAAEGVLVYKKKNFLEKVERILGISSR